jgi:hypothetical protein
MIGARPLIIIAWVVLSVPLIHAQDLSKYRDFRFGMDLPSAAKLADMNPSDAKMIHQRPAVIQELEWSPQHLSTSPDPVNGVLLGFYNGELFRMLVTYDRDRTEGLTDEDIIEAFSTKYGAATRPVAAMIVSSPLSQLYGDSSKVVACWENSEYSVSLFRSSYKPTFGIVIISKRVDTMARAAIVKAIGLDEQEAPQREADRQKKADEEKLSAGQKARPLNKANFRP